MRVLFLGSPGFAIPTLEGLWQESDCEVVGVITQPDRRAGRGRRLSPPPVKVLAQKRAIPVFQFYRIRGNPDAHALLEDLRPEVMVVAAFGQILPPDFFDFPPFGTLNVHASLLPRYRGAAPAAHAILNGETETGVTIMKIDEGMDTGQIVAQQKIPLPEDMTTGELEAVLAGEGARLLVEALWGYTRGRLALVSQDPTQATYAPRISKEDSPIVWEKPASVLHNHVRAMNPWPGAVTSFRGEPMKVWRTTRIEAPSCDFPQADPGTVVEAGKSGIVVECAPLTFLNLMELQLPSRRRVSALEFLNGTQLRAGERFA